MESGVVEGRLGLGKCQIKKPILWGWVNYKNALIIFLSYFLQESIKVFQVTSHNFENWEYQELNGMPLFNVLNELCHEQIGNYFYQFFNVK